MDSEGREIHPGSRLARRPIFSPLESEVIQLPGGVRNALRQESFRVERAEESDLQQFFGHIIRRGSMDRGPTLEQEQFWFAWLPSRTAATRSWHQDRLPEGSEEEGNQGHREESGSRMDRVRCSRGRAEGRPPTNFFKAPSTVKLGGLGRRVLSRARDSRARDSASARQGKIGVACARSEAHRAEEDTRRALSPRLVSSNREAQSRIASASESCSPWTSTTHSCSPCA